MVLFICIFVVIAVVIILVTVSKSDKSEPTQSVAEPVAPTKPAAKMVRSLRCKIAGINHRRGIADYVGTFRGYLEEEPTNKHDKNAIAIYERDGKHLGYIPAEDTADIRALGRVFPIEVDGEIEECFDDIDDRTYYMGYVYIDLD